MLRKLLLRITPLFILRAYENVLHHGRLERIRRDLLTAESQTNDDTEKAEVLRYLKRNPVCVLPYDFQKSYRTQEIEVLIDSQLKLPYVMFENKRLYYRRNTRHGFIKQYHRSILMEQDKSSPHCYLTSDFDISGGSVVVDVGAAEGIFGLMNIEKASKVYLFEADPSWNQALQATFAPFADKVEIHNKFVSNVDSATHISLDRFMAEKRFDFLKVDAEGEERNILAGAMASITRHKPQVVFCTYHNQDDGDHLQKALSELSYKTHFSKGYMFFAYAKNFTAPYFRRALIRGRP